MSGLFISRRRRSGFTLVELMIVLLLFALIAVMCIKFYLTLKHSSSVRVGTTEVSTLFKTLQDEYAVSASFPASIPVSTFLGQTAPWAIAPMFIRGAYGQPNVKLQNPWSGQVLLGSSSVAGTPAGFLATLTFTGVPAWACNDFVGRIGPTEYDTTVNGSLVKLTPAPVVVGGQIMLPGRNQVDIASLATQCAAGGAAGNTIVIRQLKDVRPAAFIDWTDQAGSPPKATQAAAWINAAVTDREAAQ